MAKAAEIQAKGTINGVDLTALHDTIKAVREKPALGRSVFRVRNRWIGRGLNRSEIGGFYSAGAEQKHKTRFVFENDEPEVLLGEDQGANPVEFILHALAGCVTTTTVYHAAARGIHIRRLETELEGELDLRGFLGISAEVPAGYQNIRVRMKIESDAEGEKAEILKKLFSLSPVFGTLTQAAAVDVTVENTTAS